jgi:hypothetical protein
MLGSQYRNKMSISKWLAPITITFGLTLSGCSTIKSDLDMNSEPATQPAQPEQQAPAPAAASTTTQATTSEEPAASTESSEVSAPAKAEPVKAEPVKQAKPVVKHEMVKAKKMVKPTEQQKAEPRKVVKEVKKQTENMTSSAQAAVSTPKPAAQPVAQPVKKVVETAKEKVVDKVIVKAEEKAKESGAPLPVGHKFGEFIFEKGYDGDHPNTCRLRVGTNQFQRGTVAVQYWISLMANELKIYTSAQASKSIRGTGVRIDNGPLHPFTRIDDMTNPVVEQDLTNELAAGKTLNLYLGFTFVEPKSAPEHIQVSLANTEKGIVALKVCD